MSIWFPRQAWFFQVIFFVVLIWWGGYYWSRMGTFCGVWVRCCSTWRDWTRVRRYNFCHFFTFDLVSNTFIGDKQRFATLFRGFSEIGGSYTFCGVARPPAATAAAAATPAPRKSVPSVHPPPPVRPPVIRMQWRSDHCCGRTTYTPAGLCPFNRHRAQNLWSVIFWFGFVFNECFCWRLICMNFLPWSGGGWVGSRCVGK